MHPVLFKIGSFQVGTYGVAYSFSIILVSMLAFRMARKDGVKEETFLTSILLALFGIMIMSKVMHIGINFDTYMDNPRRLLDLRKGHIFYGGYIGSILFPFVYLKIKKHPIFPIIDPCATYMPLGLAIHRALACTMAGCCFGKPTEMPWGISFPPGSDPYKVYGAVHLHPTQIYEALFGLALFAFLIYWKKNHRKAPGEMIVLQVAFYAIWRFFVEYFRGDHIRGYFGPMSTSQWVSIAMIVLAVAIGYIYVLPKRKKMLAGDLS